MKTMIRIITPPKEETRMKTLGAHYLGMLALLASFAGTGLGQEKFEWKGEPYSYWIQALKDRSPDKRRDAAQAFSVIGNRLSRDEAASAVQSLLPLLQDESWLVRWRSAEALRMLGDAPTQTAAARSLIECLKHKDLAARRIAADELGHFVSVVDQATLKEISQALMGTAKDENEDNSVRQYAASSLGKAGDPSTLPALIELLQAKPLRGVAINKSAIISAIGEIGAAEVNQYLTTPLRNRNRFEAFKPAIEALLDVAKGTKILVDKELHIAIIKALGQMGPAATMSLIERIKSKDRPLVERLVSIGGLGEMGSAAVDALPVLRTLLQDSKEDAFIRGEANAAIKKIEKTAQ